jgi:hypothetical protein
VLLPVVKILSISNFIFSLLTPHGKKRRGCLNPNPFNPKPVRAKKLLTVVLELPGIYNKSWTRQVRREMITPGTGHQQQNPVKAASSLY